jgi:hypothetical protein
VNKYIYVVVQLVVVGEHGMEPDRRPMAYFYGSHFADEYAAYHKGRGLNVEIELIPMQDGIVDNDPKRPNDEFEENMIRIDLNEAELEYLGTKARQYPHLEAFLDDQIGAVTLPVDKYGVRFGWDWIYPDPDHRNASYRDRVPKKLSSIASRMAFDDRRAAKDEFDESLDELVESLY